VARVADEAVTAAAASGYKGSWEKNSHNAASIVWLDAVVGEWMAWLKARNLLQTVTYFSFFKLLSLFFYRVDCYMILFLTALFFSSSCFLFARLWSCSRRTTASWASAPATSTEVECR